MKQRQGADRLVAKQAEAMPSAAVEALKAAKPMYAHFIDGLLDGEDRTLSDEKMSELIEKTYFSFKPLVPLSEEEETLLKHTIAQTLDFFLNRRLGDYYRDIYSDGKSIFGLDDNGMSWKTRPDDGRTYGGMTKAEFAELTRKKGVWKLTPAEKIWLIFGVEIGEDVSRMKRKGLQFEEDAFSNWGNRHFFGEHDGYWWIKNKEKMREVLATIREKTGRTRLRLVDLGGGTGKAARELQEFDGDMEATVVTLEQEFKSEPVDHTISLSADRIPEHMKGQADVIFSNVSFRYYLFPHIALRNALLMLSKGGQARLNVAVDQMPHGQDVNDYYTAKTGEKSRFAGAARMLARELANLRTLEAQGKIRLVFKPDHRSQDQSTSASGYYEIEKLEDFDLAD